MKKWKITFANNCNIFLNTSKESMEKLLNSIIPNQLPLYVHYKEEHEDECHWIEFKLN